MHCGAIDRDKACVTGVAATSAYIGTSSAIYSFKKHSETEHVDTIDILADFVMMPLVYIAGGTISAFWLVLVPLRTMYFYSSNKTY
jgi:hypothetical protein